MGMGALFKSLPDVSLSGLADGDLWTYQASTGRLIPITRAALLSAASVYMASITANYNAGIARYEFSGTNSLSGITLTNGAGNKDVITLPSVGVYSINGLVSMNTGALADAIADLAGAPGFARISYFNLTTTNTEVLGEFQPTYMAVQAGTTATFQGQPIIAFSGFAVTAAVNEQLVFQQNQTIVTAAPAFQIRSIVINKIG